MRRAIILASALIALPALAQDMPSRKAGLWEMTMTYEGRGAPPQTMQQCIDAATDKAMQDMSAGPRGQSCSKRETKKVGNTIVFDTVCSTGTGTNSMPPRRNGPAILNSVSCGIPPLGPGGGLKM